MTRREFLRRSAMLAASGVVMLSPNAWAARALAETGDRKRLIVIFLRGAVDGLNVVAPYGDAAYYDSRPSIAIQRGSGDSGLHDLDGHFGLHPALASVMPMWRERSLAFVHACGSPDPTRSHFDAQDFMETATPGVRNTPDGWLNRLVAALPGAHSPTEALNLGPTVPRILAGKIAVANIPMGNAAAKPMPVDRPMVQEAFDQMYNGRDALSRAYQEGQQARKQLLVELEADMRQADDGAPGPKALANDTDRLAHLLARDSSIRVAFIALGGWDTHVNQGSHNGQLANHLKPLGDGLASLATGLGKSYVDTVIIVMSEFGRTMHENGNGGTDHGHGNVMWLMGGPVRGGKVYGQWPGLGESELYQGRDLAVTTDFRTVLTTVVSKQMGLSASQMTKVIASAPPASAGSLNGIIG